MKARLASNTSLRLFLAITTGWIAIGCNSGNGLLHHMENVERCDSVQLFLVESFSSPYSGNQNNAQYIGPFRIQKAYHLSNEEHALLISAIMKEDNYLTELKKSCPFVARYAIRFFKKEKASVFIISIEPCNKAMIMANNTQENSIVDLSHDNTLEKTIATVINN